MKSTRKKRILSALLIAATVSALPACTTRPKLAQVDGSSADKPINTPEAAEALKKKHEK